MQSLALGLVLGYAADRAWADPARSHPVAGFGRVAGALEQHVYAPDRSRGLAYTAVLVGGAAGLGALANRATGRRPALRTVATAAATWAVLGGRSLEREAARVHAHLDAGDLPAARRQVRHLVGRDPFGLGAVEIARATVESVAENTSDAVVAPLLAGAVAGIPGLLAYRAVNTLDAMVGHRSERYQEFGWAAARFDDAVNLVPSRIAAALTVIAAPTVGGRRRQAWRVWRRDASRHPSPNAGQVESAFAGALGISLGGSNTYGTTVEDRGTLGDGPPTAPRDIARANRLASAVGFASLAVAVGVSWSLRRRDLRVVTA